MALAEYFDRAALAAEQVLQGFSREDLEQLLLRKTVAIAFSARAAREPHGSQILDLAVRLAARLYPSLSLQAGAGTMAAVRDLTALATSINPRIEVSVGTAADVGLVVGSARHNIALPIYVGASDWSGRVATSAPRPIDSGELPFGPGIAATLGMANVFRAMTDSGSLDSDLTFSALAVHGLTAAARQPAKDCSAEKVTLVGCGAIGNGAIWASQRVPGITSLRLIDHERIELSNLQRYVLASREDVDLPKVRMAARFFDRLAALVETCQCTWEEFVESTGYDHERVLVAVDSAGARRSIQASLPARIANAWTQLGDLGVSRHGMFGAGGACVGCLYLQDGPSKSLDELVAAALGVPHRLLDVRNLLHLGLPTPDELLNDIAVGLGREVSDLLKYAGLPLRQLYQDGVCGGGLIRRRDPQNLREDMHVPLAHQSALAGILLAANAVRPFQDLPLDESTTWITRVDVSRPIGSARTQPAASRRDGRCICEDSDFIDVFNAKWDKGRPLNRGDDTNQRAP